MLYYPNVQEPNVRWTNVYRLYLDDFLIKNFNSKHCIIMKQTIVQFYFAKNVLVIFSIILIIIT